MVRNPFRPDPRRYRMPSSVFPGWVANTWKSMTREAGRLPWLPGREAVRMRWAARHSCKRLRAERDAAVTYADAQVVRCKTLRDQLDEEQIRRKAAETDRDAARAEVARMREALEQVAARQHSDTCSHALSSEYDCDCHVALARAALAGGGGDDAETD